MLSGKVATDFGKQDAESKTLGFLGTPSLALDNQIKVDPGVQTATNPAPSQTGTLKLPSVFRGCWELVNDQQDGPVRLLPGAPEGCVYTQDSGRFCYQQTAERRLRADLFFAAPEVGPVWNPDRRMVARRAALYRRGGFDADALSAASFRRRQRACRFSRLANRSTKPTSSHAPSPAPRCSCEDQEYGRLGGQPWCVALHSDEFQRVAN